MMPVKIYWKVFSNNLILKFYNTSVEHYTSSINILTRDNGWHYLSSLVTDVYFIGHGLFLFQSWGITHNWEPKKTLKIQSLTKLQRRLFMLAVILDGVGFNLKVFPIKRCTFEYLQNSFTYIYIVHDGVIKENRSWGNGALLVLQIKCLETMFDGMKENCRKKVVNKTF